MTRHALFIAAALLASSTSQADKRVFGATEMFARDAAMTYPEGVAVIGRTLYVSGPAAFGTAGSGPSRIFAFDAGDGKLRRTYTIVGEDLSQEHALSALTVDKANKLYVISTQLGVIRIDPATGKQDRYAGLLPDLPTCAAAPGAPCSPTAIDRPPLPNHPTFDGDGNLYISDSFQATIFRVAPGGGAPAIWFQDPRFDLDFGPNGLLVGPDGLLYVALTGFAVGGIYTLPLVDRPVAEDLTHFHTYIFGGADGIAFSASGRLYVTLAVSNQISVLLPDGTEERRIAHPLFDAPANLAWDQRTGSLFIANHALLSNNPASFGVLRTHVGERGAQ